uniref:Odorant binding protein n=1 Tax=Eogystia hippophaecolus TaxID=1206364 RepID=A0A1B3P5I1_EOGHI|nr:odorant binding protein [Eogystia hippophaecolus]
MAVKIFIAMFVAIFAATMQSTEAITEEKKTELKAKLVPILTECGKEHSITLDYLKEFRQQQKRPDESNACFFACVFQKTGLLDDKGLFVEAKAAERGQYYAEEGELEKANEAVKACVSVNEQSVSDGPKGCDRAKLIYNCFLDQKQHFGYVY